MARLALLPLLALLPIGCGGRDAPAPEEIAAARERAGKGVAALMKDLLGELGSALREGGPAGAIDVCASKAQEMTERIAREQGIAIRRTSLRCRNPRNAPDAFEEAWMRAEEGRMGKGGAPLEQPHSEVVEGPGGKAELRLLRPIYLAPLCVACHGGETDLAEETRAALAKQYPEDRATGYSPGEFRGVVSVRVPLP